MKRRNHENKEENVIEVKIDELVLHGFQLSDRYAVSESIKAELERLFNNSNLHKLFKNSHSVSTIDAGSISISNVSNSAVAGKKTAGAIYDGIMNSVSSNGGNLNE